jgi:hypothetical protein
MRAAPPACQKQETVENINVFAIGPTEWYVKSSKHVTRGKYLTLGIYFFIMYEVRDIFHYY